MAERPAYSVFGEVMGSVFLVCESEVHWSECLVRVKGREATATL